MGKVLIRIATAAFAFMTAAGTASADNWITPMADNIYVSDMSIPGTHDSATGEGFDGLLGLLLGNTTARTQDLTISQQWDCGIRAFDLRPTVENGDNGTYLHIYHGIIKTAMSFEDALITLRDKLKEAPGEFAIVIMRHESDANSDIQNQWAALMDKCLTSDALAGYIADFKPELTIADLRGKILVMSRDTYDNGPHGAYINSWSHSDNYLDQTKAVISGPHGHRRSGQEERHDAQHAQGEDGCHLDTMVHKPCVGLHARRKFRRLPQQCVEHQQGTDRLHQLDRQRAGRNRNNHDGLCRNR